MLKGRFRKVFLAVGLALVFTGTIYGQGVREAWVAIYNGPGNGDDAVSDLAVDDSGNVYITGTSYDSGVVDNGAYGLYGGSDFVTIKYNSSGDAIWVRRYNGPADSGDGATALAVDDHGFVYVAGWSWGTETQADFTTIKYTTDGDTVWIRRYGGVGKSYDWINDLDIDDRGNVYVTGVSNNHCLTIKYSPEGDVIWANNFNGPSNYEDHSNAIAVDHKGNAYITGYSINLGTSLDYLTIKYTPNRETAWVRYYNGQVMDLLEFAKAIAVDDSGYVYVTGQSSNGCATIKYTPSGDTVWVRRLSGQGGLIAAGYDIKADQSGYVYVVGEGESDIPYKLSDYVTIKYSTGGDIVWTQFFDGPLDEGGDMAQALALDPEGNVYVTGLSGYPETIFDFVTIKYTSNGDMVWLTRYNGPRLDDRPTSLEVDKNGNVYVTGNSGRAGKIIPSCIIPADGKPYVFKQPGDRDFVTIKYIQCPPESPTAGDLDSCPPINLLDVIYLVNFVYDKDRPEKDCLGTDPGNCWTPDPLCSGDVDGMPGVNMADMMYLIYYVFDRDRPEMDCSGNDPYNCWVPVASESCCQPAQGL